VNPEFKKLTDGLHEKYLQLISMPPVTIDTAPRDTPKGGVYLFSEDGKFLYAGRTKKSIRDRLKEHVGSAPDCPFAWRLARKATGNTKASYQPTGSRKHLLSQPKFQDAYKLEKQRIRRMQVRYVGEIDPLKQALLEIYVAIATQAEFNDFGTH
jgi:hypothetical protein